MLKVRFIPLVCSKVLGLVLLLAAFSKITDLPSFNEYLKSLSGMPVFIKTCVLVFLPSCELVVGLSLVVKYAYRQARLIGATMFAGFFIFSIYSYFTKAPPCHCFQAQGLEKLFDSGISLMIRDFIFLIMAMATFVDRWTTGMQRRTTILPVKKRNSVAIMEAADAS